MEAREYRFLLGGGNWGKIGAHIGTTLFGYNTPLPEGARMAIIMGDPGGTCLDGPELVHRGEYDACMTTPAWYGLAAQDGKWDFPEPLNVKAIMAFPHNDRLLFAVREETGLRSLHEIRERKYPLRVAVPAGHMRHPTGLFVERVLAEYGFTLRDIESWGGKILPRLDLMASREAVVDPSFDAVFEEAVMTPGWQRLTEQYKLRFLPPDGDVLRRLEARGIPQGVLPAGHFRDQKEDVPALDFSGWLLLVRGDLPDDFTYLLARNIDEQRHAIRALFDPGAGLTGTPDLQEAGRVLAGYLHPGAEKYYREQGYL